MTIFFPDIYSGQAGISLAGALAVIAKATEGTTYTNPDYAGAKARAAAAGAVFGAYHFLHAGDGAAQAAHAYSVVGAGVPLMVDFEKPQSGANPAMIDAEQFIDAYRVLGGTVHLLYLPQWYWRDYLGSPSLQPFASRAMALVSSDYTSYSDADTAPGWQPYGGMVPAVWQYSDATRFNGESVDFNAFRGSFAGKQDPASVRAALAEFGQLLATGAYAPSQITTTEVDVQLQLPVLKQGDSGQAVRNWQAVLVAHGYGFMIAPASPLGLNVEAAAGVDGDFGPRTHAATVQLQHDLGVSGDPAGTVGAATWARVLG